MIWQDTKKLATRLLECHPLGYALGVALLNRLDFLLPHEADYWGFAEIAARGYGKKRIILDLGANCGHSGRAFLKLLPEWGVFSVEANPIHEANLEKIKRRYAGRFNYVICALGNTEKDNIFIYTPFWKRIPMHSATATSRKEAIHSVEDAFPNQRNKFKIHESKIGLRKVDTFGFEADFVKMDIQGDELPCLEGMTELLQSRRPILLVEVNLGLDPVRNYLEKMGYQPFQYNSSTRQFVKGAGVYNVSYRNVFFVPHELEGLVATKAS